jgi:hypothetical protein
MALMFMQRYKMTTIRPQVQLPPRTIARAALCPASMDLSAEERTIPSEVEVMATEPE